MWDIRGALTADVVVLVRVVSAVIDEVTQVLLRDAVSISTGVLLGGARPVRWKRRRAVQEANVIYH